MKKGIWVFFSFAIVLMLSVGSCKSEPKSENDNASQLNEQMSKVMSLDDSIDALEEACKSGDRDGALSAYEVLLRVLLDKTMENATDGIYSENLVLTEEQENRLAAISDCECLTDEDLQEITDRVEAEY